MQKHLASRIQLVYNCIQQHPPRIPSELRTLGGYFYEHARHASGPERNHAQIGGFFVFSGAAMSFPRYERYKESGVEWLGEVPEGWGVKALKRLSCLTTGITPPTDNHENYCEDSGFSWIRPEDLDESGMPTHASKFLSSLGWELTRRIQPGASLICCIGTIGKVGYVIDEVSTNQQITAAHFCGNARYYYYSIVAAKSELEVTATGNVLKILNTERLGNIIFPVPPLPEQHTIAAFLDRETGKIDVLVAEQQLLIELLKEKRQAVISHAVTKGLNPAASMKDSGVEWLGVVPAGWEVISIKWLSPVRRGASPRPIDDTKYFDDEGEFAWVRIADVSACDGVLKETTQQLSELGSSLSVKIAPGELFVSIAGTVGKPCLAAIKACIHDGFVYFPALKINPKFLYRIFEAGTCYGGLGKWGTQLNLNTDTIGSIRIALPPAAELDHILSFLDTETAKIDTLVAEAERAMTLLKERRTALISAAVTGKIDVRHMEAA